jgi:hypothetical protein
LLTKQQTKKAAISTFAFDVDHLLCCGSRPPSHQLCIAHIAPIVSHFLNQRPNPPNVALLISFSRSSSIQPLPRTASSFSLIPFFRLSIHPAQLTPFPFHLSSHSSQHHNFLPPARPLQTAVRKPASSRLASTQTPPTPPAAQRRSWIFTSAVCGCTTSREVRGKA